MSRGFAIVVFSVFLAGWNALQAAETGQIVGQLADTKLQVTYAGHVVVFLCDATTGYPIDRGTKAPYQADLVDLTIEPFWHAVTDENGVFKFQDVPVGRYRLVAQSWSGTKGMPDFMGNTSTFLLLHGVAEGVDVQQDQRTRVVIRQLGNRVLRIKNDPQEAGAFLLISLNPPIGDAILGPYGWGGDFASRVIGATHMARPNVTIFGLPDDRSVHAALLCYDNIPGFATGSYKSNEREGKLRIVAAWSNAHHDPPPRLKELTDHLEENKISFSEFLDGTEVVKNRTEAHRRLLEDMRQRPTRQVDVPGLGKRRLVDVLAALGYVKLRAATKK